MDKKIVMMAMVLLVATPILLGYAMAFEDVTRTSWDATESKNMTDLLYNDTSYSPVSLDSYSMNSEVIYYGESYYPVYVSTTTSSSTIPYNDLTVTAGTELSTGNYLNLMMEDSGTAISVTVDDGDTTNSYNAAWMMYNASNGYLLTLYDEDSDIVFIDDVVSITFNDAATVHAIPLVAYASTYADIIKGWTVPATSYADYYYKPAGTGDLYSDDLVISINLGGFVGSLDYIIGYNDGVDIGTEHLVITSQAITESGTTVGHELLVNYASLGEESVYMNLTSGYVPSSDDNWYQLRITPKTTTFSYVGALPSSFGLATAYDSVTWDCPDDYGPYSVEDLHLPTDTSIVYRGEKSLQRGLSYPVMTDVEYDPSDFSGSSNEVRIKNASKIGPSLSWAGETYTITDGVMYVDGKQINIVKNGLTLRTIYEDSEYTNYINGTQVSTTSAAPTVTMNGTWDCTVQSITLEGTTETTTEWVAGEFAWNGIDESFALVGLMTCVAVFIGLGMYGRRSGAKVGTLMIICGCAAFVFLALM